MSDLSIKNELFRKSIHLCNSLIAYSLFFFNQNDVALAVGIGAVVILFFEFLRIQNSSFNKVFINFLGFLIRDFEKSKITGASYVMISAFIVIFFFDLYICVTSILIMSYADTAAAIIGKKYGKTKIFNKTLEGSMAFLCTALIIVLIIYPEINLFYSLLAVFIATIVELLPLNIDDNLSVPIAVSLILSMA